MFRKTALLAIACAFAAPILAQVPAWGQCGGTGYTGSTVCQAGYVCTVSTAYYSECLPGAASSANSASSSSSASPSSSASLSSSASPTHSASSTTKTAPPATSVVQVAKPTDTTNPFYQHVMYPSVNWYNEIAADPDYDGSAKDWQNVQSISSGPFLWINSTSMVQKLSDQLWGARNLRWTPQIVIYNLPTRNCATNAQPNEFLPGQTYSTFLNQVMTTLANYSDVPVVIVLEPYSLSSIIAYPDNSACQAQSWSYQGGIIAALQLFGTLPLASIYLDAGSASLITTAAQRQGMAGLIDTVYNSAGKPPAVRGYFTNVGGYNDFNPTTPDPIFAGNPVNSELAYAQALVNQPWDLIMPPHFIVDQSRSGHQGIRHSLNDWCNVQGAGIGPRFKVSPIAGNSLIDALVWVKNAGESDGTSNVASPNFDPACALSNSAQPAPEYGGWVPGYFETLLDNASPSFN